MNHPTFLNLEPSLREEKSSRIVVLPLPLEKTTSYRKGTAEGPRAIIEASGQVEYFDAELGVEPCRKGIYTDWSLGDPSWNSEPTAELLDRIRVKVGEWLDRKRFILSLGGEHTITVGTIDPFLERWKDTLTVVQIDAHADLKNEYEGNIYSHACVMRRLLGRVPIVSVGIRSVDPEEYEVGRGAGIRLFYAHEIRRTPNWIDQVLQHVQTPHVYLTVDVDGLDPSVIPSTGTPEPGGLLWDETLDFLRRLAERHQIVGADVNEFSPSGIHHADYATAKLCYKIIAYALIRGHPTQFRGQLT